MNFDLIMILFWSVVIIFSCIGYGTLFENLLFSNKNTRTGIWLRSGWGLSVTLLIGGILNLINLTKPLFLIILILIGSGYYFYQLIKNKNINRNILINNWQSINNPAYIIPISLIVILIIIRYIGALSSIHFNWHDDFQSYIVYPIKMIQTGSLGEDPFSYRRIQSLAGMSFLHTLILSVGNITNLKLMDNGIGTILICGLIIDFRKYFKISIGWILFVIIVFLLIVPFGGNLTSGLTGAILFITMFQTILYIQKMNNEYSYRNAVLLSVITAGLASLKSTFIIPSVLIISFIFILLLFYRNSNRVRQIFIFGMVPILSFILLLPWMISNYKSNGTMLYPIFGKGYHGSIYGIWENSFENFSILGTIKWFPTILSNSIIILITLLLLIVIFRKVVSFKMFWLPLITYVTLLGTIVIIITQTDGYGWDRYSWPFSISILLFLLVITLQNEYQPFRINTLIKSIVAISVAMNIFVLNGNKLAIYLYEQLSTIKNINKNMYIEEVNRETKYNVIDKSEYLRYKKMQYIVPMNEIILTRLRYPFLLDFSRNVIFIADYPGGSSPPNGMPAFQGSIKLANYLNNNNIRYIAYSYKSEANFKFEDLKSRLSSGTLIRTEAKHTFDFQKNLSELGNAYKRIYDDGEIFVLDLNTPLKTN